MKQERKYVTIHGFNGSGFKPALVRLNVSFKTVFLNTAHRASMKRTAKPGLGQGLK